MNDEYFLKKEWTSYISKMHTIQMEQLKCALNSQQEALKELKKDNLSLYNAAIQVFFSKIYFLTRNFNLKVIFSLIQI